jgi:hypothetical protein
MARDYSSGNMRGIAYSDANRFCRSLWKASHDADVVLIRDFAGSLARLQITMYIPLRSFPLQAHAHLR